jgi:alkylhydroperoxidase family enzyme
MIPRQPRAVAELRRRVVDGPGHLAAAVRRQAFSGADLAPELQTYAQKVRNCAYRVTEGDVAALKEAGYTEDQIFELTVSLALGAGMARLDAGLIALGGGG